MSRVPRGIAAAAVAMLAALLAGCTSSVGPEPASSASPAGEASATAAELAVVEDFEMVEPWVKATTKEMTGAFGTLVNNTAEDVHVVAISSALAPRAELHEIVDQAGTPVMKEMADGFVVAAGGEFTLQPGGNHLMLMGLTNPIEAGTEVELTLEFEDGRTFSWIAPVRTYQGANEVYQGDDSMSSPAQS